MTKPRAGLAARPSSVLYGRQVVRGGWVWVPGRGFSIVIAGLAVAAGINRQLGPLAAAYVVLLAAVGPLAVRWAEPLCAWAARRRARASQRAKRSRDAQPGQAEPPAHMSREPRL